MTLTDIILAMNIGVIGALSVQQVWLQQTQLYPSQHQVQQAQADALHLLASWQQAPSAGQFSLGRAQLTSVSTTPTEFSWQLRFPSFSGEIHWQGSWHTLTDCE